jgi:hypothetical protein
MQPRNLLLALGPVVLLELLDGGDEEPQAASTKATLATTAIMIDLLNCYLLDEGSARLSKRQPALLTAFAGQGRMTFPPAGFPEG